MEYSSKDHRRLPRVRDSWSYLYAEHCHVDQDERAIAFTDSDGMLPVPCASLMLLLLGPGTTVMHAAIVSVGYAPSLGFIHSGNIRSFVFDVADLYKVDLAIPAGFAAVSAGTTALETRVRRRCRDAFKQARLLEHVLPDIDRVLAAWDGTTRTPLRPATQPDVPRGVGIDA